MADPACSSAQGQNSVPSSGSFIDEAANNVCFNGRSEAQPNFRINLRVPSYTAISDDDIKVDLDAKEYVVEVTDIDEYTMKNLLVDAANKTKWGTCQQPAIWYWDIEKKGLQAVATNDDLHMVFQKFQPYKLVLFVVEFSVNPSYKSSITVEAKLEKLPIRRNLNAEAPSSSAESDEESSNDIVENVDPSWMEDDDIFLEDDEVFVSLGLRVEDEAARMNLGA